MASSDYFKPLERAWDGMLDALFRPFDLNIWARLGFLAWLACLFEGPMSISSFFNIPDLEGGHGKPSPLAGWHPTQTQIITIVAIAAVALIALAVFGLAILWIKSRGKFMFIDGLVNGVGAATAKDRWRNFASCGNSLFGFLLCWCIAVFTLSVFTLGGGMGLIIWAIVKGGGIQSLLDQPVLLSMAVGLILLFVVIAIAAAVLQTLIMDFGVLHMYKNGSSAWAAAWKAVKLVKDKPVQMLVYILLLMGVSLAIGFAVIFLVLAMCLLCCSCLLLYIPYVWAVAMLPVLAFRQLFTIEFSVNAGEEFAVATHKNPATESV